MTGEREQSTLARPAHVLHALVDYYAICKTDWPLSDILLCAAVWYHIPSAEVEDAMYPGARFYAEYLELKKLSSYASDATEHFLSPFRYINTVCFQGHQFMYNHAGQAFTDRILNTGHWGPNGVYAGCKGVRCGDNDFFNDYPPVSPL